MKSNAVIYVMEITKAFAAKNVRYAICRDLENLLPNNYTGKADIDIVIHPEDWLNAQSLLKSQNWFEVLHPFDNLSDFIFLYGAKRFRFFLRGRAKLDLCFQLTCRSTNAGEWIPLDKEIQDSVWANRKWDSKRQCYTLSQIDEFVHLLARAYFDKKDVPELYRARIEELYTSIDASEIEHRLKLIFFHATGSVMTLLRSSRISELFTTVNEFHDY